ncbi:MAG: HAD family hydrolase [Saccharofermentanales bacterium]|jgi:pyrophosphatase PpaX
MTDATARLARIKAVMFDLDGTTFDTVPLIVASHQHAFMEVLGETPSEAWIKGTIGEPLATTFAPYGDDGERMMRAYIEWSAPKTADYVRLFPGAVEALRDLRAAGYKTGVVTSRRREGMAMLIDTFDVARLFDVFVCFEDTTKHKPCPEPLWLARDRLGLADAADILYVGDTLHDLQCAHHADCAFAAVRWTAMDREAIDRGRPTIWLDRFGDLVDRLVFARDYSERTT